ncbi:hypothetical protein F9C07_4648 [Aspergillus flavus]|uniref:Uncharacterized protein n=1 Tax=Aspergillus flavus (strain ATCC 200026 / FGSC A1120 / IAM 13836 / NRRL 3357 / JCM 12722 / SRRC 167) TaxID=332952 RepID=A0A7U2QV34_ASPFN|nr:hypothetical protein F9C07_4648 [Aspergillus flavus]
MNTKTSLKRYDYFLVPSRVGWPESPSCLNRRLHHSHQFVSILLHNGLHWETRTASLPRQGYQTVGSSLNLFDERAVGEVCAGV